MPALQDQHFFSGFGKIRGRSKTVMAAANDNRIVSRHFIDLLKRTYLVIS
jgi:hypothetical protein